MLFANQLAGFNVRRSTGTTATTLLWLGFDSSSTGTTSYTFASETLGTSDPNRYIIVGVISRTGAANNPTVCTVSGTTATIVASGNSGGSAAYLFAAPVPSGTSGDIVVKFGSAAIRCGIEWYRLISTTAATSPYYNTSTVTTSGNDITCSIDVPANGVATAVAFLNQTGTCTATASGLLSLDANPAFPTSTNQAFPSSGGNNTFSVLVSGASTTLSGTAAISVSVMSLASFS